MPNRHALSVIAAGESLGSALSTIGATIRKEKDDRKRDAVLKEFEDPSKTFYNPDGSVKNPLEIATRFSTGINKLISVGALNEAKGLQQYYEGADEYLNRKQANLRLKKGIEVRNKDDAAKLFPEIDGKPWDDQESLMRTDPRYFAYEGNKPAHWYDVNKRQEKQPDGTWRWVLQQANDYGETREILGGIAPTPPDPYAVKRSSSTSYNINENRGGYDTYFSNADGTKQVVVKGGEFEYKGKKYKIDQMYEVMGEPMFKTTTGEDATTKSKFDMQNSKEFWEAQMEEYTVGDPKRQAIIMIMGGMDPADAYDSESGGYLFNQQEIETLREMQNRSGIIRRKSRNSRETEREVEY